MSNAQTTADRLAYAAGYRSTTQAHRSGAHHPRRAAPSARVTSVPAATAVRLVASLPVTSTMCAAPDSSRCERRTLPEAGEPAAAPSVTVTC